MKCGEGNTGNNSKYDSLLHILQNFTSIYKIYAHILLLSKCFVHISVPSGQLPGRSTIMLNNLLEKNLRFTYQSQKDYQSCQFHGPPIHSFTSHESETDVAPAQD